MTDNHPMSDIERITATCRKLSMFAMCESLADTLRDAAADNLSHAAVLVRLLDAEFESRTMAAQRRRIRAAAFPQLKYLHDLVREDLPAEARAALPELETLDFVKTAVTLCYMAIRAQERHIWPPHWASPRANAASPCSSPPYRGCSPWSEKPEASTN